jgi:hypothetical protein
MMQQVPERGRGDADVQQVDVGQVRGQDAAREEHPALRARSGVGEGDVGERHPHEGVRQVVHAR